MRTPRAKARYHIEHERYDQPLPADTACFHAQWRRENPTRVRTEGPEAVQTNKINQTNGFLLKPVK